MLLSTCHKIITKPAFGSERAYQPTALYGGRGGGRGSSDEGEMIG